MLRSMNSVRGCKVEAVDGILGSICDIFIDDENWNLRYIVVDTGDWLPGKKIVLPPVAVLYQPRWVEPTLPVRLTREQAQGCPCLEEKLPVSQSAERQRSWDAFWKIGPLKGKKERSSNSTEPDNAHLRSFLEMANYQVEASDKKVGQVEDFILSSDSWSIPYLVINTAEWFSGKKVLVNPAWVSNINYFDKVVSLKMTSEMVADAPEYDPREPVNREPETIYYDYYGRPYMESLSIF